MKTEGFAGRVYDVQQGTFFFVSILRQQMKHFKAVFKGTHFFIEG